MVEPKLKAAGIQLHYHNHDHEFKPNRDGLIPEEELLKRTDILLEVDTYWAYVAGEDCGVFGAAQGPDSGDSPEGRQGRS